MATEDRTSSLAGVGVGSTLRPTLHHLGPSFSQLFPHQELQELQSVLFCGAYADKTSIVDEALLGAARQLLRTAWDGGHNVALFKYTSVTENGTSETWETTNHNQHHGLSTPKFQNCSCSKVITDSTADLYLWIESNQMGSLPSFDVNVDQ